MDSMEMTSTRPDTLQDDPSSNQVKQSPDHTDILPSCAIEAFDMRDIREVAAPV